jgi:hypothetical protein
MLTTLFAVVGWACPKSRRGKPNYHTTEITISTAVNITAMIDNQTINLLKRSLASKCFLSRTDKRKLLLATRQIVPTTNNIEPVIEFDNEPITAATNDNKPAIKNKLAVNRLQSSLIINGLKELCFYKID